MNTDDYLKIPLGRPYLGNDEQQAVLEVMASKAIASGEISRILENDLANKFQRKYCVVVNSGTCALYLALKILRLKKVIFPSMTCPDVLHAILTAGCEPVFADIEHDTHNIDLSSMTEAQFKGIDGLIVTHAYGHSADMDILAYYVEKYHLVLIEDFAQALGGKYKEKVLGSFGKVSITSFYAAKNMTTGQGGAILTDDVEVYRQCLYARGDVPYGYYNDIIPLNYKMTDIQAAIGLVQLKKIDKMVDLRRNVANKLTVLFNKLDVKAPIEKTGVRHAYYKYCVILPAYARKREFIVEMAKEGVSTGILYDPPLHKTLLAITKFGSEATLPVSESICARAVSLPMYPEMTDNDINKIYNAADKVLKNAKEILKGC
jgi:dTDP-4-amino-4,6-dideoxygalactose transaminase